MATESWIVGTAGDIEAEYGCAPFWEDDRFLVIDLYEGEIYGWTGYPTLEAARQSLAEIEDRKAIIWL